MKHLLHLSLLFLILSACEHRPDPHELRYNNVADSLRKYKTALTGVGTDSTLRDYMRLDYPAYREKYDFSPAEMEQLAQAFEVTYQIGATMQLMEKNLRLQYRDTEEEDEEDDEDTIRGKYSFERIRDSVEAADNAVR